MDLAINHYALAGPAADNQIVQNNYIGSETGDLRLMYTLAIVTHTQREREREKCLGVAYDVMSRIESLLNKKKESHLREEKVVQTVFIV